MIDIGSSTGGFTDCVLQREAAEVVAIDVGRNQLHEKLRRDPGVRVYEQTNVRHVSPDELGGPGQLVVADLSFISLRLVAAALVAFTVEGGDMVILVKPQFEVGKARLDKHGVARDDDARADAIEGVAGAIRDADLTVVDVARSQLSGPRGNVEFFIWCAKAWQAEGDDLAGREERPALDEAGLHAAIRREVKGAA